MNKKILSLVLALVMVLGTFSVFAEEKVDKKIEEAKKTEPSKKVQWLVDEKIVEGRKIFKDGEEKADLSLDKNIQRDEITKMLVFAKGKEKLADMLKGTQKPYSDVDYQNWANGYITVGSFHITGAKGVPMLAGYPGNKFLPLRNVTYAELAKMLVVLVKEDLTPEMVANAKWPGSWMTWAAELGIFAGIAIPANSDEFAVRQIAFEMIWNAMYVHDTRHNTTYGSIMGIVSRSQSGKIEINQDPKMTYSFDYNTRFLDDSGKAYTDQESTVSRYHRLVGGNADFLLGSLVRLIADKDGKIEQLVQLGNPDQLAINNVVNDVRYPQVENRWFGVAERVVEGVSLFNVDGSEFYMGLADAKACNEITAKCLNDADKKMGKACQVSFVKNGNVKAVTKIKVNPGTKFYVADPSRDYMREVKSVKEALNLVSAITGHYNNGVFTDGDRLGELVSFVPYVYAGYDVVKNGYNVANVIVFNWTNKWGAGADTLRVVNPSNSLKEFVGEKPDADNNEHVTVSVAGTIYSVGFPEYAFPVGGNKAGHYDNLERYDVVSVRNKSDKTGAFKVNLLVDYSEDPIVEIIGIKEVAHGRAAIITVKGLYKSNSSAVAKDILVKGADIFGGPLKVGSLVQFDRDSLVYNDTTKVYEFVRGEANLAEVSVVSVVPAQPLRGQIEGHRDGFFNGVINRVPETVGDYATIYVTGRMDATKDLVNEAFTVSKETAEHIKALMLDPNDDSKYLPINVTFEDRGKIVNGLPFAFHLVINRADYKTYLDVIKTHYNGVVPVPGKMENYLTNNVGVDTNVVGKNIILSRAEDVRNRILRAQAAMNAFDHFVSTSGVVLNENELNGRNFYWTKLQEKIDLYNSLVDNTDATKI